MRDEDVTASTPNGGWIVASILAAAGVTGLLVVSAFSSRGPSATSTLGVSTADAGIGVLCVLMLCAGAAGFWRYRVSLRQRWLVAEAQAEAMRRQRDKTVALIRSEPQVLIVWAQSAEVEIAVHTLVSVPGLPTDKTEIMTFTRWLDATSAQTLKENLDRLFTTGRAFNVILKTTAGAKFEADGRASGGRAVLRFRSIEGLRREFSRIEQHHAALASEISATRAMIDALPMPAWIRDAAGRLTWINKAYVAAVEAESAADVLARQIELLEQRQRKAMAAALASHEAYRERAQIVIGRERRPHDIVVLPLENASIGVTIDVTAAEHARGEIDRQIAAYDRTLDRVATAVAIFNSEQQLVFFNAAYQKLWQLDRDWLLSKPADADVLNRLRDLGRLPAVVDFREWRNRVLACYRTGTTLEDTWHLLDGRIIHVIGEQRPDGGVTYLYADETERFALESRYNALIDVQRETIDSLNEGVAVFGTDGQLKLFNPAFANIWQIPRGRLSEQPHIAEIIERFATDYDEGAAWQKIAFAVTALSDQRNGFEGQVKRANETVVDYAAIPLPDGGMLLTFVDVTDAKRYERALIERNEALVAADRLKNDFIGHVSYELRTPLTTIIGFSEFLDTEFIGELNDRQREYVGDITSSSKTLLAIIDDILDLATLDAGGLELKLVPVGVRAVIDAAILGVRDRATRSKLTIDIAVADDVTELMADEARLRQILYNLISNAVGFSKLAGTVRISCWGQGGEVCFKVEDSGIGMPKEQLGRVFQRFESRSHGSKHRGAGLGLSIAKSLVELHRGTIEIESELGSGTAVTVRLPLGQLPGVNPFVPALMQGGSAA